MRRNVAQALVGLLVPFAAFATASCGGAEATNRDAGTLADDANDQADAAVPDDAATDEPLDATSPPIDASRHGSGAPDASRDAAADNEVDASADARVDAALDATPDAAVDAGLSCGALTTCTPDGGAPYCTNAVTDNANCGTCGHACPSGTVCSGGACNTTCGAPLIDCAGACVDGQNDPNHCGASTNCQGASAGVKCATGQSCVTGSCVCDNKTMCSGACVDTTSDVNNCGGCGNVCSGVCVNGGCATSCSNLLALAPSTPSGTYMLDPDGVGPGAAYSAYCDMTHDGGGWTLALKANGAIASSHFTYGSALWTNTATLNAGSADRSHSEAKFQAFSRVVASAVLLEMVDTSASPAPTNTQVITLQSPATLLSLVNGPYTPTALGRSAWVTLADDASLELNCNVEGFNAYFSAPYARARIGLIANNENDCNTPDSAIGFGVEDGPSNGCYTTDPSYSVGVVGGGTCAPDGPDKTLFGYVFVR
ncbi:MAG TPA: fibrinogen-like YCDxxxxGGGW domain-containing protein [Polyangiaceae bacterium]|jgi:hypothetical protein